MFDGSSASAYSAPRGAHSSTSSGPSARPAGFREDHTVGLRGQGRHRPQQGSSVSIETVVVPDPGPGEAIVDVQACGVCHTDLHYLQGGINDDFPFLLGHEAAGIVTAVGEGVTNVAVGNYVILNWRAVCGQCRACLRASRSTASTRTTRAEDDSARRHRPVPGARHRRLRGEDTRAFRAMHEGRPGRSGDCGRSSRLRRDGRHRGSGEHRCRQARRERSGVRLRWGGRRGDRRRPARRRDDDRGRRHRRPKTGVGQDVRRYPHGELASRPMLSRPSAR